MTLAGIATGTVGKLTVEFPVAYTTIPAVSVCFGGDITAVYGNVSVAATAVSRTGMTIVVANKTAGTINPPVRWSAMP